MRIALVNPPLASVTQPFLALASLQGHLRREGFEDLRLHDISQQVVVRLLSPAYVERTVERLERTIARLESQSGLDLRDSMQLEKAIFGRESARQAVSGIEGALATLRDPTRFYQPDLYAEAMRTVDRAFEAISAAHFPQVINRSAYTASVTDDLDDPEQLCRWLDDPNGCLFYSEYESDLADSIALEHPRLIGLSATFASQFLPALVLARSLKRRLPGCHIVLGGAFVTARLTEILRRPWLFEALESMIVYEGETAIVELAKCIHVGAPFESVPNLIRLADGRVVPPTRRHSERLQELAPPDYSGYDIGLYLSPSFDVPYDPTRGCYWGKCAFCATSLSTRGSADRRRSLRAAADDLQFLCARYRTNVVTFAVDAVPVGFMRDLAEELVRRRAGIRWTSEFTLDKAINRATLDAFAESGCRMLLFGVESASSRVLQRMRKGTLTDRTERILQDCHRAGIAVLVHLMIGFPGETNDELEATIRLVERQSAFIDLYELSPFGLVDDSPMADDPVAFGIGTVGPIRRAFNPPTMRSWTLIDGVQEFNPSRALGPLRERLDRALGLSRRRYLRQDGAHLHLYLAHTNQRPREFAPADPLGATQPKTVHSRYDLVTLFVAVRAIRRRWEAAAERTHTSSAGLWQEHAGVRFQPDGPFVGNLWPDRRAIERLPDPEYAFRPETPS